MRISKEFLMEAVSLSLLVALILVSMQMFQRTMKLAALLERGQEQQISELEEYEIVKYEGLYIDGMTVISYMKRMIGLYQLPVKLITEDGNFILTEEAEMEEVRNAQSEKYINPFAKYRCEVTRDANGAIQEIKISVETKGDL